MTNNFEYESNEIIQALPDHLKQFILPQNYEAYTSIDQAVWRYVMRKNVDYLSRVAHPSYLDGLRETGIQIDRIPSMYGMNRILKKIGWAAVAVDGFIPPNAFMEFQAYKILVIASDIRQLENIEYTPAPDIIHEAAGHAPIIANPDYAEYLRRLGAIGSKAIMSGHDIELYEAVRKLSILKESDTASNDEVQAAENDVIELQSKKVEFSEMTQIRNLQWWSVEYGLIGEVDNPKIYGAGLLSSIGESKWCMQANIKKLPYSIEAAKQDFDITKPQPQLFVTPDFSYLMEVLEEFANKLSLRKGGISGLEKLIESRMVGTIELSTGLQVSGKFVDYIEDEDRNVCFFRTEGPTALAYREKQLIGHGIENHSKGFCSPLGKLKNINLSIEDMGPYDLKAYNFYDGKWLSFEFESGIKVEGMNITGIRNIQGKLMLIQLADCTVSMGDKILSKSEDGIFDMVVGNQIISAYAGAADHNSFPNLYEVSETLTHRSTEPEEVDEYYKYLRTLRESRNSDQSKIEELFNLLLEKYPDEWLLILEIHELAETTELRSKISEHLKAIGNKLPKLSNLINDGILLNTN